MNDEAAVISEMKKLLFLLDKEPFQVIMKRFMREA